MSYAGSVTAQLLRSLVAGRIGQKEGEAAGGVAVRKANVEQAKETREALLAAAQAAAAKRTAGLTDPNDPSVLRAKEQSRISGDIAVHQANRSFDVAHPTRDPAGPNGTGVPDKAYARMRAAYKAKLMAPTHPRFGAAQPGMSEDDAEELTSQAWGPPTGEPVGAGGVDTSTRALMGGSILRGGGAARTAGAPGTPMRTTSSASSATSSSSKGSVGGASRTTTSSGPAADPKLNVAGGKKGNIDLRGASPAASAVPTGSNLKERDMTAADLWDKKVNEGMTPVQATAYVHRLKG